MHWNLGSDRWSEKKIIALAAYGILGYSMLMWIFFNDPTNMKYAIGYFLMITGFFVILFLDKLIPESSKIGAIVDTVVEEDEGKRPFALLKNPKVYWAFFALIIIITSFSVITKGSTFIASPTFQVAPFLESSFWKALLSGFAGLFETLFFFSALFPTAFGIMHYRTGNPLVALLTAVLITASFFTFTHFLVYGTANMVASMATFAYGSVECFLIFMFRSTFLCFSRHFTNNFIAEIGKISIVGLFY